MSLTVYPMAIDAFPVRVDGPDQWIRAEHINFLQDAITAVEEILGVNPQGAYSTVSDRIAAAGGLASLEDDPAPTLGAALNTNGKKIQSPNGVNLEVETPGGYFLINGSVPLDSTWANANALQTGWQVSAADSNGSGGMDTTGFIQSGKMKGITGAYLDDGANLYPLLVAPTDQVNSFLGRGGITPLFIYIVDQDTWGIKAGNGTLQPNTTYTLYMNLLITPS